MVNYYSSSMKPKPLVYPEITSGSNYTCLLLIDSSVKNYEVFVNSVNSTTFPIVYSSSSSPTDLLALLNNSDFSQNLNRIGIVFTSNGERKPFIGYKPFFPSDIVEPYSDNILLIINIIKQFNIKNIDYLACNTLNHPSWVNYYKIISDMTGVIVGASNDETGNIKYGGDWVMESDGINIEEIYFTSNIKSYQYLLDPLVPSVPPWCILPFDSFPGFNIQLVINGGYMYVSSDKNNTITQVNMNTGINTTYPWFNTGLSFPEQMVIYGNYLYVANWNGASNGYITQININDKTSTQKWYDNTEANGGTGGGFVGLALIYNTLYASDWGNGKIIQITINNDNTSTLVNNNWAPTINLINQGPYTDNKQLSLLIYNNIMYCGGYH